LLVIILFLQTLRIFIFIFFSINNIWVRFLYFLIFIGGLIIIFVYLASILPNEIFSYASSQKLFFIFIFIISLGIPVEKEHLTRLVSLKITPTLYRLNYTNSIIIIIIVYLLRTICVRIYLCQKLKTPLKNITYVFTKNTSSNFHSK